MEWQWRKNKKSKTPTPDWSDDELFVALGHNSGSFTKQIEDSAELWRQQAQQALSVKYQRRTAWITAGVGVGSILISLAIAIGVPWYQQHTHTKGELVALYRTIDANGNIFVNNYNNIRDLTASDTVATLPNSYANYSISDDLTPLLQQKLGMVNYTFLLYYLDETQSLNKTQSNLRDALITYGPNSSQYQNTKRTYLSVMNYLGALDGWQQTKFNYVSDTGCLDFLLQSAFTYIPLSSFDRTVNCSTDTLNRIFYWFGYLPPLTPGWMRPLLHDALNKRETGLGDQIIQ